MHSFLEAVSAFSTLGLLGLAYVQIMALRRSQITAATLEACNAYSLNSVLVTAQARIFPCTNGRDYSFDAVRPASHDVLALLHFFDSLAIGIRARLYDERIVEARLGDNVRAAVDLFTKDEFRKHFPRRAGEDAGVPELMRLRRRLGGGGGEISLQATSQGLWMSAPSRRR